MVKTSYLRVYQPLSVFPADESDGWLGGTDNGESPTHVSNRWLLSAALPQVPGGVYSEGAFVRRIGNEVLVCPWRTRLRMLTGLLAFRHSVPAEVADAFVPEGEAAQAASELASLHGRGPQMRSHILHSNWHVPLRWFALFEGSERILTEGREGVRIRYETTLVEAGRRLKRALRILQEAAIDDAITESVQELAGWLEDFSDEAMIELDYASVSDMFEGDELADDHSAADVASCLDSLASGDLIRAGRIFATLSERWGRARSLEAVN